MNMFSKGHFSKSQMWFRRITYCINPSYGWHVSISWTFHLFSSVEEPAEKTYHYQKHQKISNTSLRHPRFRKGAKTPQMTNSTPNQRIRTSLESLRQWLCGSALQRWFAGWPGSRCRVPSHPGRRRNTWWGWGWEDWEDAGRRKNSWTVIMTHDTPFVFGSLSGLSFVMSTLKSSQLEAVRFHDDQVPSTHHFRSIFAGWTFGFATRRFRR